MAAIRAALWARSDKQAALLLTMSVQERLTTPKLLVKELLRIKRDRRRTLIAAVITDLLDGLQSLGEHDVADAPRHNAVALGKVGCSAAASVALVIATSGLLAYGGELYVSREGTQEEPGDGFHLAGLETDARPGTYVFSTMSGTSTWGGSVSAAECSAAKSRMVTVRRR